MHRSGVLVGLSSWGAGRGAGTDRSEGHSMLRSAEEASTARKCVVFKEQQQQDSQRVGQRSKGRR